MRIIKREIKKETRRGCIKLVPESLDDLWHLKHVIETGDNVSALTYRRMEPDPDKIRPERMEKKPVKLGIRVEEVNFHQSSSLLRVRGVIESGIDIGSHHTINVLPNKEISIEKTWRDDQVKRIEEAIRASSLPKIVIVTIEEGEAVAGLLRQYGVDELFRIRGSGWKEDGSRRTFFGEVSAGLNSVLKSTGSEAVVIAGPGFIKNDFFSFLRSRYPEIAKKCTIDSVSGIGISGFQEVLRRGTVERISKEMRICRETRVIEELMEKIAKDGNATYGYDEVRKAAELGAIEILLIADEIIRKEEDLVREVERAKGDLLVFSTEFEPGKRLLALGGLAAILRWKI
jgi:protein pelota